MSVDTIPQVLILQPDLAKMSKQKPPILSPSLESKNVSPAAHKKISTHSPNKKNYVTVKKFNSSLATVGSCQNGQKLNPKMQFIQKAALGDLQEKYSSIPLSPKNKHRRTSGHSKNFESKQVESVNSNGEETSMSKLIMGDSDNALENCLQIQEDCSENSSIDNSSDTNLLRNPAGSRKRKGINCSNSFSVSLQNNSCMMNSFSYIEFQKKVSKSHSIYNGVLNNDSLVLPKSFKEIKSVSSKVSLSLNSADDQKITIQFTSNWGNPKCLLMSTVTVMDEKRKAIPINTISSVPDLPKINLLEKFADHKLVKDENDVFTIDYDLSMKEKFSLILSIDKSADPRYVRIWNPTLKDKELLSASVKNVTIYLDHKKVAEGEIPQNFGVDIEFESENDKLSKIEKCNTSLLINELFPSLKPEEKISDAYGIYPFGKSKEITIEVLKTYKNTERIDSIGINGVDFYNDKGIKLSHMDFDLISVKNIFTSTYANPKNIVRDSMNTCCMDYQFLGNYQPDNLKAQTHHNSSSPKSPMFIFTLNEPTAISMIRIWNFNSLEADLDNGIKKLIVRNNNRIIWTGKIRKGSGLIQGIDKTATNIWLTDSISIRDQISKHLINDFD